MSVHINSLTWSAHIKKLGLHQQQTWKQTKSESYESLIWKRLFFSWSLRCSRLEHIWASHESVLARTVANTFTWCPCMFAHSQMRQHVLGSRQKHAVEHLNIQHRQVLKPKVALKWDRESFTGSWEGEEAWPNSTDSLRSLEREERGRGREKMTDRDTKGAKRKAAAEKTWKGMWEKEVMAD